MKIEKGQKYYLISEDTRNALTQLLGILMEKGADDLTKYKKGSEDWRLARKCQTHFTEIMSRLIMAEGGTCVCPPDDL